MDATVVSLPWAEIFKLALSAGLTAAVFNQFAGWLRDRWKESATIRRDVVYLAARVAVILEEFAIECAEIISDNELYKQSDEIAGTWRSKLPILREYPADADWKALTPSLMMRALSFRNELPVAATYIRFWADVEPDPDTIAGACDAQAGKCGHRAWHIAAQLRRDHNLSEFDPKEVIWDILKVLKKHHDAEMKRIKDHNEN